MGFFKDTNDNNFVHHEIKTYQRRGDQVRSEYERLNPDGSVTKTIAYGDTKEGLKYRTFHLALDGTIKELVAPPRPSPRRLMQNCCGCPDCVCAPGCCAGPGLCACGCACGRAGRARDTPSTTPQATFRRPIHTISPENYAPRAVAAAPATQPRVEPPPPPPQPKVEQKVDQPRKAFAFIVEPKEADDQGPGVWRVRTLNLSPQPQGQAQPLPQQQKRVEPPAPAPAPPAQAPAAAAPKPWWYDPFKEMISEGIKREEKPVEKPVLEEKKPRLFNLFDDDAFFRRPFASSFFRRPRIFDAIDEGRSLVGDFFNGPLLPDY